jgi:hypothetical protein
LFFTGETEEVPLGDMLAPCYVPHHDLIFVEMVRFGSVRFFKVFFFLSKVTQEAAQIQYRYSCRAQAARRKAWSRGMDGCFHRGSLQGKRGIEKLPFQLPSYIADTGIVTQRDPIKEKEANKLLKAKHASVCSPKWAKSTSIIKALRCILQISDRTMVIMTRDIYTRYYAARQPAPFSIASHEPSTRPTM